MEIGWKFVMKCWVGFSHHDNIFSNLIASKIGKPYSHIFMVYQWNSEMVVLHATGRGVNALEWERFKRGNTVVKLVEITDEERTKKAFKYCISRLGQKYGFLAVIAIGLGIHYEDGEKTLICSEYVARALDIKFDKLDDLVTPADIEGKL
jgi:uncharacterized protein YycO